MLIGFNNIHFSWKETILLIEERREEKGARGRGKKRGAPFHFQVRPWDEAFETALHRFTANEIKWCRPWQKGKPKLKAIYFHWGMWHCSGTINGLWVDRAIERGRTKSRQTYKGINDGTDESRESLDSDTLTNEFHYCIGMALLTFYTGESIF